MEAKANSNSIAFVILVIIVFSCAAFSYFKSREAVNQPVPTHTVKSSSTGYINVFKSYEDRKIVITLTGGEKVTKVEEDASNDYCKIVYRDKEGWLNCELLDPIS